ncbi:Holliday junction resolvase-like protein [Idiomarina xiamenensis 10-D-4]|uniref:Holliday junction resolvase-like protein n=1 Tax=Idiomarina xiamenensis 10-D-4 TaxID=740709 RepID=K2LCA1_9GAMM|nr:Holliday junction resolvase-like protein [Idiomarina xiamenensis 10-D-4]
MDGSEQDISIRARKFANRLHGRFGLPVALQDERLTTAEAKALLFAEGGYRNLQKAKIDSLSAVLILQDFFANAST